MSPFSIVERRIHAAKREETLPTRYKPSKTSPCRRRGPISVRRQFHVKGRDVSLQHSRAQDPRGQERRDAAHEIQAQQDESLQAQGPDLGTEAVPCKRA